MEETRGRFSVVEFARKVPPGEEGGGSEKPRHTGMQLDVTRNSDNFSLINISLAAGKNFPPFRQAKIILIRPRDSF